MASEPKIELEIPAETQPNEITENYPVVGIPQIVPQAGAEVPTITTLLQRKKLSAAKFSAPSPSPVAIGPIEEAASPVSIILPAAAASEPSTRTIRLNRRVLVSDTPKPGAGVASAAATVTAGSISPPPFRGVLALEKMDLKAFQKALKKHRKRADMRKLDCLGYFSSWYSEIAFFSVAPRELVGKLGFGSLDLVTKIPGASVTARMLPSVFEVLSQGEVFAATADRLRAEDQGGLALLGFHQLGRVGVFPVFQARIFRKNSVVGMWLCASKDTMELPAPEIKALKKCLVD